MLLSRIEGQPKPRSRNLRALLSFLFVSTLISPEAYSQNTEGALRDCIVSGLTIKQNLEAPYFQELKNSSPFQSEQNRIFEIPERASQYQRAIASGKFSTDYYKKLGFFWDGKKLQAPDEGEILLRLHHLVETEIQDRSIPRDRVLTPVKVFRNELGKLEFLTTPQLLSLNAEQLKNLKPLDGILSDSEFRSCVSKGFFPVGSHPILKRGQAEMTTFLMHDLAHFQGFLENPGYAQSFRNFWSNAEISLISTTRPGSAIRKISDESTEFLSVTNPEIEPLIRNLVRELPPLEASSTAMNLVEARAQVIESWSSEKREKWIRSMTQSNLSDWEKPVGGNQLDPPHADYFREKIAQKNPTYFTWKTEIGDLLKLSSRELASLITYAESGLKLQPSDFMGALSHPSQMGFSLSARHPQETQLKLHFYSATHLKFQVEPLLIPLIAAPAHLEERVAHLLVSPSPSPPTSFQSRLWRVSAEMGGTPLLIEVLKKKQDIRSSRVFANPQKESALDFLRVTQRAITDGISWGSTPEYDLLKQEIDSGLSDEALLQRLVALREQTRSRE